jgi:acyl dehydratase
MNDFDMSTADVPELIHGRHWEDMTVGFTFRTGGRTITETDLVAFVNLTGASEPLFYDERFARDLGHAGRLVPGMQTFCYAEGLVIQTGSIHGTGLAHMHCEIDIRAPVYVGDTISVVVEVIGQRAASKGNRGVITSRNAVYNQRDEVVMVYEPVRLTKGRP